MTAPAPGPVVGPIGMGEVRESCPHWAQNLILAGYRGSESHGTSIRRGEHATDDVDVFAISVQPEEWYLGLQGYAGKARQVHDTAGSFIDLLVYDVRKFFHLLAKGNPNVHVFLWLRPEHYLLRTRVGSALIGARRLFLSRRVLDALAGYATSQFKKMERGVYRGYMGEKRKAMTDRFGYDVKHASHCIRLLHLGIELCQYGTLRSYRPEDEREVLVSIKRGEWSLERVKAEADRLWELFRSVEDDAGLPDDVDRAAIDRLLVRVILEANAAVVRRGS